MFFLGHNEKLILQDMRLSENEFLRLSTQTLRNLRLCNMRRGENHDPRLTLELARKDAAWLEGRGRFFIPIWDPAYPWLLRQIYDPPFGLYVRYAGSAGSSGSSAPPPLRGGGAAGGAGNAGVAINGVRRRGVAEGFPVGFFNDKPHLAVVGTRKPSVGGMTVARDLGRELGMEGVTVVSGLARGIDSAAHVGLLSAGSGRTVAVFGHGCDRIYPLAHTSLAAEILQSGGALISEYPPGTKPLPFRFPERNRIISGISSGVVLVEAPEKSGALITVDFALEQGREVIVMAALLSSRRNEGGKSLYEMGAPVANSTAEVLQHLRG